MIKISKKMPENCVMCFAMSFVAHKCQIEHRKINTLKEGYYSRPDWCPLVEEISKKRESRVKLPCVCGRKRLETWWGVDNGKTTKVGIKCPKCEREAVGDSEISAIKAWNRMIKSEAEEQNV